MEDKLLEKLIRRYEAAVERLVEADKELISLRDDQFVTWEWVCWYLGVEKSRAIRMLADNEIYVFDQTLERFRKSDIVQFAQQHKMSVKERTKSMHLLSRIPPKQMGMTQDNSAAHTPVLSTKLDDKQALSDEIRLRIIINKEKAIERAQAQKKPSSSKSKKGKF